MSDLPATGYQFIVEEGKVYKISPTIQTNILPQIQIIGDGTVDLSGSFFVPTSVDDPVLESDPTSIDLVPGIYRFAQLPPYIKFTENQTGSRQIALIGFAEPVEIIF